MENVYDFDIAVFGLFELQLFFSMTRRFYCKENNRYTRR